MEHHQLKLSQFVNLMKQGIQTLFGEQEFLIIAQVNAVKRRNTRVYLDLIEYEDNKVVATSHGVVTNSSVLFNPLKERGLSLDGLKGQQLLMTCTVVFNKDYGYQLHIVHISSEYTLGSIKKKEQSNKDELIKLWIYNLNKQKQLGIPPYRIAIISWSTSEWLKDFLQVFEDSWYCLSYELFPTAIHGNQANTDIHKTLKAIYSRLVEKTDNNWEPCLPAGGLRIENWEFDLVLIVRGGGWSSGIMRHNDLNIAKGVCHMPIPVMMAVGHTSDQYLLDEVACMSAKTPTDAAYQLISKYDEALNDINKLLDTITNTKQQRVYELLVSIDTMKNDIDNLMQQKLSLYRSNIDFWYDLIMSTNPDKLLQSGYALLLSLQWNLLDKSKILSLGQWDEVLVKIYDKQMKVKILE